MKISFSQHIQRKSKFEYKGIGGTVLSVKSYIVMRTSTAGLELSKDNGETWTVGNIPFTPSDNEYISAGHILTNEVMIFFTSTGNMYRSTDGGKNFTQLDMSSFGKIIPPLFHGVASVYGHTCIFAEYPTGSVTGDIRVFRSNDYGATWKVVLTQKRPEEISHFHSVHYDEMTGKWIITSGDEDPQIRWWISTDGGTVFNLVLGGNSGIKADQRHRLCNMIFTDINEVMWVSDSGVNQRFNAVYKAKLTDLSNIERVFDIINVGYSILSNGNVVMVNTNFEGGGIDRNGYVYVSMDGGKTFDIDLKWPLVDNNVPRGGFSYAHGPSADGSFFFLNDSMSGVTGMNNRSTKMTLI